MWKAPKLTALAMAAVLGAPACGEEVCGCPPEPIEISGMIFGTVFAPDSSPLAGAIVQLTGGVASCEASGNVDVSQGISDDGGDYEAYFEAYDLDEEAVCVIARAHPPAGPGAPEFAPSDPIALHYDDEDYNQQIVVEHDFYLNP